MSIWRSALSILGAFFVVVVLVGLATALSSNLMLGGMGPDVEITVAYLVVNLAYSVLIAVIGGYIAATVSDHSPLGHAAGLAGFMMVLGLFSWLVINRGDPAPGQPSWYPGPPLIQWTRKCLSFSSVPHPRWSQKLPLRQRRRGVEGSSIPRSSDEPQWSEGPKCSRRLRVLRFEVDRRLIAQR